MVYCEDLLFKNATLPGAEQLLMNLRALCLFVLFCFVIFCFGKEYLWPSLTSASHLHVCSTEGGGGPGRESCTFTVYCWRYLLVWTGRLTMGSDGCTRQLSSTTGLWIFFFYRKESLIKWCCLLLQLCGHKVPSLFASNFISPVLLTLLQDHLYAGT